MRFHVFSQNLVLCQQQFTMQAFSKNKLCLLSTISRNFMSHDFETPMLIAYGPVSAQNSLIEDVCKFKLSDDLIEDAGQLTIFGYFCQRKNE